MNHPHYLTVTEVDGERTLDWTHPGDCPDGDGCETARRTRRARSEQLFELVEGRPVGRYLLGRFGFHGLVLIDETGTVLPDVMEALSPTAQAAREIAVKVIRDLAGGICEDTERLQELGEIIRRAEALDHWESAANDAVTAVIDENLASMRAYTGPIDRLLGEEAAEPAQSISRPDYAAIWPDLVQYVQQAADDARLIDPAALAVHLRALRRKAMTPTRGAINRILEQA